MGPEKKNTVTNSKLEKIDPCGMWLGAVLGINPIQAGYALAFSQPSTRGYKTALYAHAVKW